MLPSELVARTVDAQVRDGIADLSSKIVFPNVVETTGFVS